MVIGCNGRDIGDARANAEVKGHSVQMSDVSRKSHEICVDLEGSECLEGY